MTDAAAEATSFDANAGRLGVPLLSLATRVLRDVPPGETRDAVSCLRAFTHAPTAARYLIATRALQTAERRHKLRRLGQAVGPRRTEEALDVLARGGGCAPELVDALRALPPDARNGRRLNLIADLIAAHTVIEARAAGALRELQRSLGPLPRRPPPRQGPDRRGRRRGR
jgi:hypothetical protein